MIPEAQCRILRHGHKCRAVREVPRDAVACCDVTWRDRIGHDSTRATKAKRARPAIDQKSTRWSKQTTVLALLSRPSGTTIAAMMEATPDDSRNDRAGRK